MEQYVGLDVSQKKTAICVIDGAGTRLWEGTCRSTPAAIAGVLKKRAPMATRVWMEDRTVNRVALARPKTGWGSARVPPCPAREGGALAEANKTDRNDGHRLAQIVRTGWYRAVEMKSLDGHEIRVMLQARQRLVGMRTTLHNQVRGLLKTFGVVLPSGRGSRFLDLVRTHAAQLPALQLALEALLGAWREVHSQITALDRALQRAARAREVCRRWMRMPGIGPLPPWPYTRALTHRRSFADRRMSGPIWA